MLTMKVDLTSNDLAGAPHTKKKEETAYGPYDWLQAVWNPIMIMNDSKQDQL